MISADNAVITILSSQFSDGELDESELNTTGTYRFNPDGKTEIAYAELDESGKPEGETLITVHNANLVTVQKTGFTEAMMILERGRTHPVTYVTALGTMEIALHATKVTHAFHFSGGLLRLQYRIEIGGSFSSVNTIELRVRQTSQPSDRATNI